MKTARLHRFLALAFLVAVAGACRRDPHEGRITLARIPAPALRGSLFENDDRQPIMVYLPPGYEGTEDRYPVVYYLPGFATDVTEYLDQSFQGMNLKIIMDDLIHLGRIRPMIVVVANGRNFLGGSYYVNSPVTGNWEDFIVRDVVAHIDGTFRTIAVPAARGITGDSMGGAGAINLAMKHPDIFGSLYAISPTLFASGGLPDQAMFSNSEEIGVFLQTIEELETLPRERAIHRFREIIRNLYDSGNGEGYRLASIYAYGAAFAPAPDRKPPFIDFPYSRSGDGFIENESGIRRFENGLGGLEEKVAAYRENLARLRMIVIDYGKNDQMAWVPQGCEHLSELLDHTGIVHEVRAHNGSHFVSLRLRIEYEMLPFFSKYLQFDEHASQASISGTRLSDVRDRVSDSAWALSLQNCRRRSL